jgi:hypothetical protein
MSEFKHTDYFAQNGVIVEEVLEKTRIADIPSGFIKIPGSKNEIMESHLTLGGKFITDKNYVEFKELIKKIGRVTGGDEYRLPFYKELSTMYFESKNRRFFESCEDFEEWTDDVIRNMRWIVQNPSDTKIVHGMLRFEGEMEEIGLARYPGYFFDNTNKYGYPLSTQKKEKEFAQHLCIKKYNGNSPVICSTIIGSKSHLCPRIGYSVSTKSTSLSARLVRINE